MAEATELTVVTWNIRGSARPDLDAIAAVVAGASPDVLLLQEVWREHAYRLANLLDLGQPFWSRKHRPFGPLARRRAEGMAIIATARMESAVREELPPRRSSWSHRRRIVQYARVPSLGVTVVNVHLASHGDATSRLLQARTIAARVSASSNSAVIVGGDFNADTESALWDAFAEVGLTDAATEPADATSPAGAAAQRLDRVLIGPGLRSIGVRVPEDASFCAALSDHLPVIARLSIAVD